MNEKKMEKQGGFISIVGASGCGKSTLVRMIAVLEIPTNGEIRIGGKKGREAFDRYRNDISGIKIASMAFCWKKYRVWNSW